ncbi:hypothetical protein N9973_00680 [bacterium]|nr:hypothetical protein [bacterium]
MDNEEEFNCSELDLVINGNKIEADDIWELIRGLEKVLTKAGAIEYDSSLEILSREARAVLSKCGY